MSARRLPAVSALFVFALICLCTTTRLADAQTTYDRVLYVDNATGSDNAPGTQEEPLRTIQAAMNQAQENKNAGRSTRVVIAPGVYRESVEFAYSNYNGGGTNATVVVEGAGPEKTVIKGSEVFTGWKSEGNGVFSHEWTKNWGVADDPTGGYIEDCGAHPDFCADEPNLVLRREMIFVDGTRMQQVISAEAMKPGTFRVDESANKLYLQPPTGTNPSDALVEVAVRSEGWTTRGENNVTIRGLSIEQVATPWKYGSAALVVAGNNHTVENVAAVHNNYNGLRVKGEGTTIRDFALNRNGASGLSPYKVVDFLMEDGTANRNNWRGTLGGYTGWSVGNKFFKGHGVTVHNVTFNNNHSRGLWLDTDLEDVLLEDVEAKGNLRDNIWVERTQGPVTLRRVTSTKSNGFGILVSNSVNTTIEDSRFIDNEQGGILISGDEEGREIENFETGASMHVQTRHLTLTGSVISGVGGNVQGGNGETGGFLIGTTFWDTWADFVDTYEADNNMWFESDRATAFEWRGNELISLEEWQRRTGEDQNSVFAEASHRIALREGWNLVSSHVQPNDSILSEVFSDLLSSVSLVKNETGDRFIPDTGENTIGTWKSREAYIVHIKEADTLLLEGKRLSPDTTSIALQEGWNLVPYFGDAPMPVDKALASLSSALVMVKDNAGQVYLPSLSINNIGTLYPGQGYKMYVSEKATFAYPSAATEE